MEKPADIPLLCCGDFGNAGGSTFFRPSDLQPEATLIVTTFVKDEVGFSNSVAVNEVGNGWGAYDLGLFSAYLILAARDLGYDSLIMGIRDAGIIREKLCIPESEEIMSVIAIGKRSVEPSSRPRKDLSEIVKFF